MDSFLSQASLYLAAAAILVPIAARLGLGSVLGYLAAGILLGPVLGLAGAETEELQHVAEFGVVMMLFLIGLELEPRAVWDMRHRLLGLGGSQVLVTAIAITALLAAFGQNWRTALALGLILCLSSTAIVLQTLSEKNLRRGPGGRAAFSVLLMQDIAVIPVLAVLPLLALPETTGFAADLVGITNPAAGADHAASAADPVVTAIQRLPGWARLLVTLAAVPAIVLIGRYLTRPVFRFIHATRLPEMSTFVSLLVVIGIAYLMTLAGLSPALGTFVAGVVLANSEFRHQIEADIQPFKGLLLGLFFMTVGVGIDFQVFARAPLTVVGLTLALLLTKAVVLFVLGVAFRLKGRDRFLFALSLAQGGEFGFVLVSFARSEGVMSMATGKTVLLVISLSMLLTPLLFLLYDWVARQIDAATPGPAADRVDASGSVLIAGIGRFGQVVDRLARSAGLSTVVLDSNMAAIEAMRRFGVKGFFGDPARPELLEAAGLARAEVLVVAVDDRNHALRIVRHARRVRPDLHIIARAADRVHVYEMYQAGADDIVRETFDSSVRAGRYVLENMGFSVDEAAAASDTYARIERSALRDLARLWMPGVPAHLNDAYVARARQLDQDIETALGDELGQSRSRADLSQG